ncbi:helix-turn-helix transcriptional regulator [bacterium]|nr:helix-turn-helix transcriptional regulator [bacterium]
MDVSLWNGVFWNHMVYPELSSDDTYDPTLTVSGVHKEALGGRFPDYVICLCLDDYHTLSPDERRSALEAVKDVISSRLQPSQRILLGFAHANSLYWCGMLGGMSQPELIEHIKSLHKQINESASLSVTIGLAFLADESMQAWRLASQLAVVAQRSKVRLGSNQVFVYDEKTMSPSPFLATYWRLGNSLYRLVRSGDKSQVGNVMYDVSHTLFTSSYLGLIYLRPILQSMVILMAQGAIEVGVESTEVARDSERCLSEISTTYDYSRLKELLEEAAAGFTAKVHARFHSSVNQLSCIADSLIKDNLYDPELSLHYLARKLGVNASYLSRAFKKAMGAGVVEHINRLRIDEAKRLLLDNNLSITDIAFRVGFGSVQHFGRVFRAIECTSPSEYRSKHVHSG